MSILGNKQKGVLRKRAQNISPSAAENTKSAEKDTNKELFKDLGDNAVSKALFNSKYLMILQVASRLMTFTLNQLILPYTTAEVFGRIFKFDFLQSTILFLCREGFRSALLRSAFQKPQAPGKTQINMSNINMSPNSTNQVEKPKKKVETETQIILNLGLIPVLVSIPFAIVACFIFARTVQFGNEKSASINDILSNANYNAGIASVVAYGLGAVLELFSEPLYVLIQYKMLFQIRALAEISASLLGCLSTFLLVSNQKVIQEALFMKHITNVLGFSWLLNCSNEFWVLLSFSISQIVYSLVLFLVYLSVCLQRKTINWKFFVPKKIPRFSSSEDTPKYFYFDRRLLNLAKEFTIQSVIKHLLTEGDKMVIDVISSENDTGLYAIAANYGSLPARMLYQPIEESSKAMFSKLGSNINGGGLEKADENKNIRAGDKDSNTGDSSHQQKLAEIGRILSVLLRSHLVFAMFLLIFGLTYIGQVGAMVLGKKLTNSGASSVLTAYITYLPFLAINGILEAFAVATMTKDQVKKYTTAMTIFSVFYCATILAFGWYLFPFWLLMLKLHAKFIAWVGLAAKSGSPLRSQDEIPGFGAISLVIANMVNMAMRILWCTKYSIKYFGATQFKTIAFSSLPSKHTTVYMLLLSALLQVLKLLMALHPVRFLGVGALLGVLSLAFIFRSEIDLLKSLKSFKE